MTDEGFSKGQSDNLPKVDMFMVATFIKQTESFSLGEIRGVKAERSGRQSYGDAAVGWVQVRRDQNICTVKAKITPEHNVKKKQYSVSCSINEISEEVIHVQCHDCAASLGGCKHVIAFLMWLHRRSEEPSPTEVACYWQKSKLSKVGTSLKFITLKEFGAKEDFSSDEESSAFLREVLKKGVETGCKSQMLKHFKSQDGIDERLGLHHLMHKYVLQGGQKQSTDFFTFCSNLMDIELCNEAAIKTSEQSNCSLWYNLRYARITASKLYDAVHCKKCDGAFVNTILGVSKFKSTSAMERGKTLEKEVLKCLEKKVGANFKYIGLQLNPKYPIFGASPDALYDDYCVEVKCPTSEKSISFYLTKDNRITAKYNAQVQLQMFLLNKTKCLFCIADPDFENNSKLQYIWVEYDEKLTEFLLDSAEQFWKENIFKHLYDDATNQRTS